jgi:PAS domain S-box-containing protein
MDTLRQRRLAARRPIGAVAPRPIDPRLAQSALVLESLRDAVAVADPAGHIVWTNAAHARLYGLERDEAHGHPLQRFGVRGPVRELELAQEIRDALARRGHWSGRFDGLHKAGTRVVTDTSVTLLPGDAGDLWVSVQRDVTEHLHMEELALATLCLEQRHVGVELHEGLGQELAGAAMLVRAARNRIDAGAAPDPALLGDVEALLQDAVAGCRELAQRMSPFIIHDDGLGVALQDLARRSARERERGVVAQACADTAQLRGHSAYQVLRVVRLALGCALQREAVAAAHVQVWREVDRVAIAVVADGSETAAGPEAQEQRMLRHWLRVHGGAIDRLEVAAGRHGVLMLLPVAEFDGARHPAALPLKAPPSPGSPCPSAPSPWSRSPRYSRGSRSDA